MNADEDRERDRNRDEDMSNGTLESPQQLTTWWWWQEGDGDSDTKGAWTMKHSFIIWAPGRIIFSLFYLFYWLLTTIRLHVSPSPPPTAQLKRQWAWSEGEQEYTRIGSSRHICVSSSGKFLFSYFFYLLQMIIYRQRHHHYQPPSLPPLLQQ